MVNGCVGWGCIKRKGVGDEYERLTGHDPTRRGNGESEMRAHLASIVDEGRHVAPLFPPDEVHVQPPPLLLSQAYPLALLLLSSLFPFPRLSLLVFFDDLGRHTRGFQEGRL